MASTPEDLYSFTERWMFTYEQLSQLVVGQDSETCNTTDLGNSTEIEVFGELCELI